jgi:PIN domain nuclease of toxin-antitoxin system
VALLLDTHAFLWWVEDDQRLPSAVRAAIADAQEPVHFSAVSAWEIAIKVHLGRLRLAARPDRFVPEHVRLNAFRPLPVSIQHALGVHGLPDHHTDPFDRLLIAQAQREGLEIVSGDSRIGAYDVNVRW